MEESSSKKREQRVNRFAQIYMTLGMCMGIAFGSLLRPEQMGAGMSTGLAIGMALGLALGAQKDTRLSQNMLTVTRIEDGASEDEKLVWAADANGAEKCFTVSKRRFQSERFALENRVAKEKEGILISLESR